jgi:hypothetical protein
MNNDALGRGGGPLERDSDHHDDDATELGVRQRDELWECESREGNRAGWLYTAVFDTIMMRGTQGGCWVR